MEVFLVKQLLISVVAIMFVAGICRDRSLNSSIAIVIFSIATMSPMPIIVYGLGTK